jgi:hypothetical protein
VYTRADKKRWDEGRGVSPFPLYNSGYDPHESWSATSVVHAVLGACGFAPVVGEPCDGVDAGVYAAQGDWAGAGLSAGAMVPFVGWGAGAGKLGRAGTKVAKSSDDDSVDVWRVVGPEEAADIAKSGSYGPGSGNAGKYFYPTRGQAEKLADMYTK